MFCVRQATFDDLLEIQNINAICLPENYRLNFYINHILTWPQLLHVAEDYNRKIVGYVLGSLDEELSYCHGQIASLAVLRTHRKLGCATRLMRAAEQAMQDVYGAGSVSLHVRKMNHAAFCLYSKTLGYKVKIFEAAYYRDGADAYEMIKLFADEQQVSPPSVDLQDMTPHLSGEKPPLLAQEAVGDLLTADSGVLSSDRSGK
jgi:peptide alpha-N-acetyltransferase